MPEGAKQHIGKRPVHGLAHDDRKNETGGAIESAGNDQHLAVEHEAQQGGREAGVRVQKRNDSGHVGAANRSDQHDAEDQSNAYHGLEDVRIFRMNYENQHQDNRRTEHREADEVLSFISNGALRQNLLQLARGDQTAGDGERTYDDFETNFHHLKPAKIVSANAHVILRNTDDRGRQGAEGVA